MTRSFAAPGVSIVALMLLFGLSPALAQTASQITPPSVRPAVPVSSGAISIPELSGPEAPKGAAALSVRLADVELAGAEGPAAADVRAASAALRAALSGKTVTVAEIFAAARALEAAYGRAGYVLTRVVVPAQRLKNGGRLKIVVIAGFIERLETKALPSRVKERVEAVLAPLVGRRSATLADIERALVLAGDTPGLIMKSTLVAGAKPGGSVLVIEGRHTLVTGSISADNQARALLAAHATNRRATATFATQQRWLLAHLALAQYFQGVSVGAGFYAESYLETVVRYGVASANTAAAFLKEMQHYGFVLLVEGSRDRRIQWLAPASEIIELISAWLLAHLALLDGLDDGDRCKTFAARPGLIGRIQPLIADALVQSPSIREPQPAFSLFTWLNEGGIVMDWLYAGLGETLDPPERIATSVRQLANINALVQLSRTHLSRKLRAAEEMGSLGWLGKRGQSQMWVSRAFVGQYEAQQATKLAIVDTAFAAVVCPGVGTPRSV